MSEIKVPKMTVELVSSGMDRVLYGHVFSENHKWAAFGAQYANNKGFEYLGHHPTEQEALDTLRAWVKDKTEAGDLCWIKEEEVRPTIGRISKYAHLEELSNVVSDVKAELEPAGEQLRHGHRGLR